MATNERDMQDDAETRTRETQRKVEENNDTNKGNRNKEMRVQLRRPKATIRD
jgi:hypothetical protein